MTKRNKLVYLMERLGFCFGKKRHNSHAENEPEMTSLNEVIVDDQDSQTMHDINYYFDNLFDQDAFLMEKFMKNASLALPELSDLEN